MVQAAFVRTTIGVMRHSPLSMDIFRFCQLAEHVLQYSGLMRRSENHDPLRRLLATVGGGRQRLPPPRILLLIGFSNSLRCSFSGLYRRSCIPQLDCLVPTSPRAPWGDDWSATIIPKDAGRSRLRHALRPARFRDRNTPRMASGASTCQESTRGMMRPRHAAGMLVTITLGRLVSRDSGCS